MSGMTTMMTATSSGADSSSTGSDSGSGSGSESSMGGSNTAAPSSSTPNAAQPLATAGSGVVGALGLAAMLVL